MTAIVLRADARALPLPDASVDLIVTSPPYWALRSYTDGGEHYAEQIGSEPTPAAYIASLVECTREWMRVLKPSGSIFVNLGDSYYSGKGAPGWATVDGKSEARTARRAGGNPLDGPSFGIGRKSLILVPERYRIACVDELGLIARAVVVWSKPNGLPESVTDRVRRSHEDWVHLTKLPRYFSAVDEIREAHVRRPRPNERLQLPGGGMNGQRNIPGRSDYGQPGSKPSEWNPLGRLPGSVWTIPTEPLTVPDHLGVDHFAAFPTQFPRLIILGWSPSGICVECGEGSRPVVDTIRELSRPVVGYTYGGPGRKPYTGDREPVTATITGYACACIDTAAPTLPSVIVDPFGGTGTTALVAHALGRIGVTVDRSADYCRIAQWRVNDPAQIAKAMRVEKPPVEVTGQGDLLEGLAVTSS